MRQKYKKLNGIMGFDTLFSKIKQITQLKADNFGNFRSDRLIKEVYLYHLFHIPAERPQT